VVVVFQSEVLLLKIIPYGIRKLRSGFPFKAALVFCLYIIKGKIKIWCSRTVNMYIAVGVPYALCTTGKIENPVLINGIQGISQLLRLGVGSNQEENYRKTVNFIFHIDYSVS